MQYVKFLLGRAATFGVILAAILLFPANALSAAITTALVLLLVELALTVHRDEKRRRAREANRQETASE